MQQTNAKIKYFLYARKSSESEDRQVQSTEDQVKKLHDLAKDLDLQVIKIFVEAKSAKQPNNRPIFEEMLGKIEQGEADGILCWQINRLSRNPVDSGRINWMLQQGVIKIIRTTDRQYLPEDNVLMFSVESGMANQFILDLRKNTKRGLEGKAERGWFPSKAPQGYLNDALSKTIVKDSARFELIRKMWNFLLTGNYLIPQILKIANDEWGYRTEKTKREGDRPLSMSGLYRLFHDPFYTGYFKYNGKLYKGNHEAMITMGEFERAQEILHKKEKPRHTNHEFAFTGVIRCGYCGCLITAEEKKKFIKSKNEYAKYVYYHCSKKKREADCREPAIRLKDLEEQIVREIGKYTIPEEFKDWALGVLKEKNSKEVESRGQAYEMANKTYLDLQKQLDNLTELRIKEMIGDGEFTTKRAELQEQITKARERLNQSQDRGQNWVDLVERAFNFAAHAREAFIKGDLQTKREILSALGQTYILKSGKLKIEPVEWLVPISNFLVTGKKQAKRLEPANFVLNKTKTPRQNDEMFLWGGYWELNPG
ncbi:MAG: recombinase family protein [Patescibacteria group bacterium]